MTASMAGPAAPPVDLPGIRQAVDTCLEGFLSHKSHAAAGHGLPVITQALRSTLFAGGKRLRPLICALGWYAAGGRGAEQPVVQVAASLEMFHAFALIHDDIMDRSEMRRGQPTVHRMLACHLARERGSADCEQLGASTAILIGDLALAWSDELLHTVGLHPDRLAALLPLVDAIRTEVMYGQYLDLVTTGRLTGRIDAPLTVIRLKTAKYTCERPLQVGAALAGAGQDILAACTAYALPLGEAFQLRDDLLGVFGDPAQTGKSCLDDLRDGKLTVLVALAYQRASLAQRAILRTLLGDAQLSDQDADRIRGILIATGAPRHGGTDDPRTVPTGAPRDCPRAVPAGRSGGARPDRRDRYHAESLNDERSGTPFPSA